MADEEPMKAALAPILDKVWQHCEANGVRGRTTTLKAKYSDFVQVTRSRSLAHPVASRAAQETRVLALVDGLLPLHRGVRLLGVSLSTLQAEQRTVDPVGSALATDDGDVTDCDVSE